MLRLIALAFLMCSNLGQALTMEFHDAIDCKTDKYPVTTVTFKHGSVFFAPTSPTPTSTPSPVWSSTTLPPPSPTLMFQWMSVRWSSSVECNFTCVSPIYDATSKQVMCLDIANKWIPTDYNVISNQDVFLAPNLLMPGSDGCLNNHNPFHSKVWMLTDFGPPLATLGNAAGPTTNWDLATLFRSGIGANIMAPTTTVWSLNVVTNPVFAPGPGWSPMGGNIYNEIVPTAFAKCA